MWLIFNILGTAGLRLSYRSKTIDTTIVSSGSNEPYTMYSLFFSFRNGEAFLFLASVFTTISFLFFAIGFTMDITSMLRF